MARFSPITEVICEEWGKPIPPMIPTGIAALDNSLAGGGFAYGLATLTGATGRGKSGFAIQVSRAWAKHRPVLYLYSEMGKRQIVARIIAQACNDSWQRLLFLGPDEIRNLQRHAARADGHNIFVEEVPKDPETLPAFIDEFIEEHDQVAPIIVFDFLQGAARRVEGADVRSAVNRIIDMLNGIAERHRTIVLCLSAESRAESKADPSLRTAESSTYAAKESGDIEYAAAYTLYLQAGLCPQGGDVEAKLMIGKQRYGAGGLTIGLRFHGASGVFTEDASAALTAEQHEIVEAVRNGADSANKVHAVVKGKKETCLARVNMLVKLKVLVRAGVNGPLSVA